MFTVKDERGWKLTVECAVDGCWKIFDLDFKALLDVLKNLFVFVAAYERDCETLGAESASAAYSVQVGVGVVGHVEVEHDVDLFDINAAREDVRRDQEAQLELLE